jgi:hypothetical protein
MLIYYALADATRKEQRIELHFVANTSERWLRCAAEAMRTELRRCQGLQVLNVGENIAEKFERLKHERVTLELEWKWSQRDGQWAPTAIGQG